MHNPPCALESAQADEDGTRDFGEQTGVRHPVNSLRLILSPSAPSLTTSSAASGKVCTADCRHSEHAFGLLFPLYFMASLLAHCQVLNLEAEKYGY